MIGSRDNRSGDEGRSLRCRIKNFRLADHPTLIFAADDQDFAVFQQCRGVPSTLDIELGCSEDLSEGRNNAGDARKKTNDRYQRTKLRAD